MFDTLYGKEMSWNVVFVQTTFQLLVQNDLNTFTWITIVSLSSYKWTHFHVTGRLCILTTAVLWKESLLVLRAANVQEQLYQV